MHVDVLRAINTQINSEFQAWYQYLAMAAFCEREKFTGAAKWLKLQSVEEYHHGMKLFDFVLARNGAIARYWYQAPNSELIWVLMACSTSTFMNGPLRGGWWGCLL